MSVTFPKVTLMSVTFPKVKEELPSTKKSAKPPVILLPFTRYKPPQAKNTYEKKGGRRTATWTSYLNLLTIYISIKRLDSQEWKHIVVCIVLHEVKLLIYTITFHQLNL
mmetsp:Transcript_44808/g.65496  ORF Transcript_44808/g.65496 Transcript_44808/m.65496 type:complete len:109 (-) Transcript_44808:378-704(-)